MLLPRLLGLYGYWGERIGRFPAADGGVAFSAQTAPLDLGSVTSVALVVAQLTDDNGDGVVDTADKLAAAMPAIDEMIGSGMVVLSDVDVVFYRHERAKPGP